MCHPEVIFALVLCAAATAPAADAEPQFPLPQERRSEDGVQSAIYHRDLQLWHDSRMRGRELREARRARWMDSIGLDLVLTYDTLAMGAASPSEAWGGASGDVTLNLRWQITRDDSRSPLSLNTRLRDRHAYSDTPPSGLRSSTDALWGYVDGFNNAGFQVPEFFFEDRLFDRRLTLRYGQMSIDDLLDGHELRSAKRSFMNQAFSSSPAVGFPGSDLGFVGRWQSRHHWDITLAVSNVAGSNLRETTEWKLDGGALFEAVQLGRDFTGIRGQTGRLQLLAWRSDALPKADLSPGRGVSLTYEQTLSRDLRFFVKYAFSEGEAAITEHFASAGLARDLSRVNRVGIALAAGQSAQNTGEWQGLMEVFYRRQIGKSWMITPDLQIVAGDRLANGDGVVVIGGVRMGMTF